MLAPPLGKAASSSRTRDILGTKGAFGAVRFPSFSSGRSLFEGRSSPSAGFLDRAKDSFVGPFFLFLSIGAMVAGSLTSRDLGEEA